MKTNVLLAMAWIWIAIPLGWGVYQSVQKSLPLFSETPKAAITTKPAT